MATKPQKSINRNITKAGFRSRFLKFPFFGKKASNYGRITGLISKHRALNVARVNRRCSVARLFHVVQMAPRSLPITWSNFGEKAVAMATGSRLRGPPVSCWSSTSRPPSRGWRWSAPSSETTSPFRRALWRHRLVTSSPPSAARCPTSVASPPNGCSGIVTSQSRRPRDGTATLALCARRTRLRGDGPISRCAFQPPTTTASWRITGASITLAFAGLAWPFRRRAPCGSSWCACWAPQGVVTAAWKCVGSPPLYWTPATVSSW